MHHKCQMIFCKIRPSCNYSCNYSYCYCNARNVTNYTYTYYIATVAKLLSHIYCLLTRASRFISRNKWIHGRNLCMRILLLYVT